MQLQVNGKTRQVQREDELLLWVLRDELGLTGTHYGCGIGICGSCTVLVDGQVTRSCLTPVASVAGKAVTTLEGLAKTGRGGAVTLHPVQQAFVENPLQCGWCLPGHVMSAVALLNANPAPTPEQIDDSAGINLCRCGGYNNVRKAVARAAELKRGGL
ncbi:(2Fe-2S)-binding protein [Deinococcus marmoris]|uniref:(2Fe-2S)-binding protein n=1 Tax=Deinococcus marmoris TaxID=249408 RepID=UPI000497176E|nr:(2Fe-2S)-binding protein [Deinococcus marmoris]